VRKLVSIFILIILITLLLLGFWSKRERPTIDSVQEAPLENQNISRNEETWLIETSGRLNTKEYVHPQNIYKLEYPEEWAITEYVAKEYTTIEFTSDDYELSTGYPVLLNGVGVTVTVTDTDYKNIQEIFNSDALAQQIANNVTEISVDEKSAISYDYSYEGTIATIVSFVAENKQFTIKYRYTDESKDTHLDEFENLVNSFEIIPNQ
jgi:hypothetical protein